MRSERPIHTRGEVKVCGTGFHACLYPLEVLKYYPPNSKFALVEQSGVCERVEDGGSAITTKIASERITIIKALNLDELIQAAVSYTFSKARYVIDGQAESAATCGAASATGNCGAASATGDCSAASATGYCGAASATGDCSAASATGYGGAASAAGYGGAASATGYRGAASATGHGGVAVSVGQKGMAKASESGAIVLVLRDAKGGIAHI